MILAPDEVVLASKFLSGQPVSLGNDKTKIKSSFDSKAYIDESMESDGQIDIFDALDFNAIDVCSQTPIQQDLEDTDVVLPSQEKPLKKKAAYTLAKELMEIYSFGIWNDQLYYYNQAFGYWKIIYSNNDNREIRSLFFEEDCHQINKLILNEIYEWLRIEAEPLAVEESNGKRYLNFKDCAVDWRTGECVENRKELLFLYYLDLEYHKRAVLSNGAFDEFMQDVFGEDKQTQKEFYKFIGLCFSGIRNLKTCAFLYGPSNTGKTVMLNLLKGIIGKDWTASVSFSQLGSEFAVSRLLGKRLNISGEVSGTTNKKLDLFKSLTGNDEVEICFKGKDYFSFKNQCILVFACNNFPPIHSIDEFESFLSRIIIFPFLNVKPRSEWEDNL